MRLKLFASLCLALLSFSPHRALAQNQLPVASASASADNGDATPPQVLISTANQTTNLFSFLVFGTATDAGRGDNGISSVTINGVRSSGDTAIGGGVANWSAFVTLVEGPNVFTVVAKDNSGNQNAAMAIVTITLANSGLTATASTYHVFPQFADGRLGDTIYKTTLMISNPRRNAGSTCSLRLRGVTLTEFPLTYGMGGGGWEIKQSSGSGEFQSGYATLSCTAPVEAQLLYSIYSAAGRKISETTVFSSPPSRRIALIGDEREGARLGVAIANDSDVAVTYTVSLSNAAATGLVTVPPRSSEIGRAHV